MVWHWKKIMTKKERATNWDLSSSLHFLSLFLLKWLRNGQKKKQNTYAKKERKKEGKTTWDSSFLSFALCLNSTRSFSPLSLSLSLSLFLAKLMYNQTALCAYFE